MHPSDAKEPDSIYTVYIQTNEILSGSLYFFKEITIPIFNT